MNTNELEQIWNDLAAADYLKSGYIRIRIPSSRDLYLAINKSNGCRAILLEVRTKAIPAGTVFPESVGFRVYPDALIQGPNGRIRLILELSEAKYQDVFSVLAADLIEYVSPQSTDSDGIRVFLSRLGRWQLFFRNHLPDGLGKAQQTGLYGELWFLRRILLETIDPRLAIAAWSGPQGSNQDFQLSGGAVEVKSSTANLPDRIRISNVLQLDNTGLDFLILCHLSLEVHAETGESLPRLVNDIRILLDSDDLVLQFNDRLMDAGYLDIQSTRYENTHYRARKQLFFKIVEGFPRLLDSGLQVGIVDVAYSILLESCMRYCTDETEMKQVISRGLRSCGS